MKATVEAVALFATTGSLIVASTIEMFLRDRTVHTPARKPHYDIVGIVLIKKDNQDALWRFLIFLPFLIVDIFWGIGLECVKGFDCANRLDCKSIRFNLTKL